MTTLSQAIPTDTMQLNESELQQNPCHVLQRLTLIISNACNMACKYCYANGGAYYTHGGLMDAGTALNAINSILRRFEKIEHVNFFGGEPTLNLPIIELVCRYFVYLRDRGILSYLPQFGLTTNAYKIHSSTLQLLLTYNFSVTVSLDGPKEIHDRLRIDRNGMGTFDSVCNNIRAMIDLGIRPEFECTYTAEHYRNDIDIVALMDFFYDNFRCSTLHCPLVIADPTSHLFIPLEIATKLYIDAVRYSVNSLACGIPRTISVAARFLNSIASKSPICEYCPAGRSTLAINADGNIYGCFMLMHGATFCLGNVNGEKQGGSPPDSIRALLDTADKWRNQVCRDCWCQSLCFGCLGEDLARGGPAIHRSTIPGSSQLCDYKRGLVEACLLSVTEACQNDRMGTMESSAQATPVLLSPMSC